MTRRVSTYSNTTARIRAMFAPLSRIYDADATKAVVKKWVGFYKRHREILESDIIHLRRPDGRGLDGIMHVNA